MAELLNPVGYGTAPDAAERSALLGGSGQEDDDAFDAASADGKAATAPGTTVSTWQVVQNMARVALPFFRDPEYRARGSGLLLLLVAFVVSQTYIEIHGWAYLAQQVPDALVKRDTGRFWTLMWSTFWTIVGSTLVTALVRLVEGALALEWRRWITRRLLVEYVGNRDTFYQLKLYHSDTVDNPDQRIGQDTDEFARNGVSLVSACLTAACKLGNCIALYRISFLLFVFAIGFALLLTALEVCAFGGTLVSLMRKRLSQEASLRFGLMRLRESAESIAFYQGGPFEMTRCREYFGALVVTLYKRLAVEVTYQWLNNIGSATGNMLPKLVLGPMVLSGTTNLGVIYQSEALFGGFVGGMLVLAAQLENLASVGAQAVRISELQAALKEVRAARQRGAASHDAVIETNVLQPAETLVRAPADRRSAAQGSDEEEEEGVELSKLLSLNELTLIAPGGVDPLYVGLSLVLREGQSLIICGESGCGKSSLLRAIAGLWKNGHGTIDRCSNEECFFMPQKPYLCMGSLRENAAYPLSTLPAAGQRPSDEDVEWALGKTNVGYLAARYGLDTPVDFEGVLSGGEKQRLGFARVLLRRSAKFAMLDEATAALDEANESSAYELLRQRIPCYVSVGHRPNLEQFHTHKLLLEPRPRGGCRWSITRIPRSLRHAATSTL